MVRPHLATNAGPLTEVIVFADPIPASRSRRSVTVRNGNDDAGDGFISVASNHGKALRVPCFRTPKPVRPAGALGGRVQRGSERGGASPRSRLGATPGGARLPTGSARDRRRRSGFLSRRRRWSARAWRSPLRSSLRASRDRPRSDRNRRNGNTVAVPAWPSERETLQACPGKPTSCR
jgi:hypothetical protein